MTRPRTLLAAAAASVLVVVGLLLRPLLPTPHVRAASPRVALAPTPAPADVRQLAAAAAIHSLCGTDASDCAQVTVDRMQGYCPTARSCLVALVADQRIAGVWLPVAVTLTVTRTGTDRWQVGQVRS